MAKKLLFSLTDATTTAGYETNAREFYSCALMGDDASKRSSRLFRTILTMGEKTKLGKLVPDDVLQEAECDFAGTDVDISQKTFEPVIFNIGVEVCQWDIEASFLSDYTKNVSAVDFLNTQGLMPEFQSHLLHEVARRASNNIEKAMWVGDTGGITATYLDEIDGLITQMVADNTIHKVQGTALTSSNILTEIEKVVTAIPTEVDNVQIGVNARTLRLYKLATAKLNHRENYTHTLPTNIIDYEIVVMPGMPDDTIVAANFGENFVFATDLTRETDLNVIPMKATTGDRKVRVIGDIKWTVGYLCANEVVFYATTIS